MDELTATYSQLCDSSTAQLQQLVQQQAKEEQRKVERMEEGCPERGRRREVAATTRNSLASCQCELTTLLFKCVAH